MVRRALKRFAAGWVLLLTSANTLFAQEAEQAAGDGEKSYILAYVLVLLIVSLGIVLVCRPTQRADRPKMVQEDLEARIEQMSGRPR